MPSFDSRDFWLRGNNGMNAIEEQRQRRVRAHYITAQETTWQQAREALRPRTQRWSVQNGCIIDNHPTLPQNSSAPQGIPAEAWPAYIEQLYNGCTVELKRHPTFPNLTGTIVHNKIHWPGYGFSPELQDIYKNDLKYLCNVKHPNGSPFVLKELTSKDRVLNKIKLLQTQFKQRTLRKTKNKPLPLPA